MGREGQGRGEKRIGERDIMEERGRTGEESRENKMEKGQDRGEKRSESEERRGEEG